MKKNDSETITRTGRKKGDTLSLRLDPKTKFILDFIARINGQTITSVVERAIRSYAENVILPNSAKNWSAFWDVNEGIRKLKLLADADYPSSWEEDELRQFTLSNWEFFYFDSKGQKPCLAYVEILWPKIEEYFSLWKSTHAQDYWAAGKKMANDLKSANFSAPMWPRRASPNDDDIPF